VREGREPGNLAMIGIVVKRQPLSDIGDLIALDMMAVAVHRDQAGGVGLAVIVDDEAGDASQDRATLAHLDEQRCHFRNANVERDMFVHRFRRQAEGNTFGHMVGGVIGDDEDRRGRIADDVKGSSHAQTLEAVTAS
jgi:hypothetical protein